MSLGQTKFAKAQSTSEMLATFSHQYRPNDRLRSSACMLAEDASDAFCGVGLPLEING